MTNLHFAGRSGPPIAVILGINEIASAIAVDLHRGGFAVVLSHDPLPPVIRRKMAFHDALFDDAVTLDGIAAQRADSGFDIRTRLGQSGTVIVTELGLLDLIVIRSLDLLVDARLQKHDAAPDLRPLAGFTVGVGPGFCGGSNCHVAIETRPEKVGRVLSDSAADPSDGEPRRIGGRGGERFVRAPFAGRWHTAMEIGTRVFKDFVIGHLGNALVRAPFDGILRGVVRDGTEVPAGVKLLEIDPRGRRAVFCGLDSRAEAIAKAVAGSVASRKRAIATNSAPAHSLIK
jgi:hypothetical protein